MCNNLYIYWNRWRAMSWLEAYRLWQAELWEAVCTISASRVGGRAFCVCGKAVSCVIASWAVAVRLYWNFVAECCVRWLSADVCSANCAASAKLSLSLVLVLVLVLMLLLVFLLATVNVTLFVTISVTVNVTLSVTVSVTVNVNLSVTVSVHVTLSVPVSYCLCY